MKRTSKIGLFAVAAWVLLGTLAGLSSCRNGAQAKLERTRRALRQEGFKLELGEFHFGISPEESTRAAALEEAGRHAAGAAEAIDWLPALGTNAALVLWNQPDLESSGTTDLWGDQRRLNQAMLGRVCQTIFSGPCLCPPPRMKDGPLEYYTADWSRFLVCPLAARALLELHDRDQARAWTNLLALTRLVAEWRPQPFVYFYTWRDRNLRVANGATWQALQAGGWNDAQLAALQQEWESADVRSGLPEMAAFARASVEQAYRHGLAFRHRPQPSPELWLFGQPRRVLEWLTEKRADIRYRLNGKYEDEEVLLRLLRDCEKDYRRAEACSSWKQITGLPGIASWTPGASNLQAWAFRGSRERLAMVLGLQPVCGFAFEPAISGPPPAPSRLGRVANWETRRRLLVAAIAIERYRLRRGSYPESLDSLAPEWLASPPLDFMDGRPFRYRRTEDGHFLLYSIGVDCTDDGGNGQIAGRARMPAHLRQLDLDPPDLVWPRPASPPEVAQEVAARRRLTRNANRMTTFVP